MKKTAKSDMTAPNKARALTAPGELGLMREELRLMRKALEDIASKLTPQCPQYPRCPQYPQYLQWWHTPAPAAPHWDRTPEFPTNWTGRRASCADFFPRRRRAGGCRGAMYDNES